MIRPNPGAFHPPSRSAPFFFFFSPISDFSLISSLRSSFLLTTYFPSSVAGSAIWCRCPWDGLGSGLRPRRGRGLRVGVWHHGCWFQNNLRCAVVTHFASDGHRDHSSMCLQLGVVLSKNCNLQRQAWRCTSVEQSKLKGGWRRVCVCGGAHVEKPINLSRIWFSRSRLCETNFSGSEIGHSAQHSHVSR